MEWSVFFAQLTEALVPVIATGLTALISVGVAYLSGLVKQKFGEVAEAKANAYLTIMQDVAMAAVIEVQQSMVDQLKASGKWNKETAAQVKQQAVEIALDALGNLRFQIQKQLLIDVPEYMARLIEVALKAVKDQTAADR